MCSLTSLSSPGQSHASSVHVLGARRERERENFPPHEPIRFYATRMRKRQIGGACALFCVPRAFSWNIHHSNAIRVYTDDEHVPSLSAPTDASLTDAFVDGESKFYSFQGQRNRRRVSGYRGDYVGRQGCRRSRVPAHLHCGSIGYSVVVVVEEE